MARKSSTPLPNPAVSQLFEYLADAYSLPRKDIADEIARSAISPGGTDSDPSRETIMSYVKPPRKSDTSTTSKSSKRNSETPLHHRFAHIVLNYLDGRRPDNRHEEVHPSLENSNSWKIARRMCKEVLAIERDKRFEQPLTNDPGPHGIFTAISGVYATRRQDSANKRYSQELLILKNDGTQRAPRLHCTYVTQMGVTRGEWILVGRTVHCALGGYRSDNTHDVAGLFLAYDARGDLLSGILAGTATSDGKPVWMPVVAVKVEAASRSILDLGDLGDEAILARFQSIRTDFVKNETTLKSILEDRNYDPIDANARLRADFDNGKALIDPNILEFCKSTMA